jgi:GntR family transcriptional repressor for pyruvate dehydrogenase complex
MEFHKVVKPRRVYEEVLEQIKDFMREGKLNPGDRLMGEREMANALGVSRTTLREALRTLEILSLVEVRHGDGTFIKDHQVNEIIEPLALALSVEPNSFEELWETRIALEVQSNFGRFEVSVCHISSIISPAGLRTAIADFSGPRIMIPSISA